MAARRIAPFVLLALSAYVQAQSDPASVEAAFTSAKIVPDVIPAFAPTVGVQLTFDDAGFSIPVDVGVLLTINQTKTIPTIALKSSTSLAGKAYLVAMVDPDAPTPQNKSVSEVRHWLAPNYVAGAPDANGVHVLTEAGAPVGKYAGPGPAAPSDPHRYTVLVYEQPTTSVDAPTGNDVAPFLKFDLGSYIARIPGLTLVGGIYFRVGPLGTVPTNGTSAPPASGSNSTSGNGTDSGNGSEGAGSGTGAAGALAPALWSAAVLSAGALFALF